MTDQPAPTDDTAPSPPAPFPDPDPEIPHETVAYAPIPEHRPAWASPLDRAPVEPVVPMPLPTPTRVSSGGPGLGTILAAALLSAVLASGGTVLVLEGTGALDRAGSPGATQAGSTSSHGPVAVDDSSAIVSAAANVSPAVVRITATGAAVDGGGSIPETGVGSGVIYDKAGWILTNRHVVLTSSNEIAAELTVELKDGTEYKGSVYGIDTLTDLAIVRVDATNLPAAPIGRSADIKVGQLAIAIGSPLGTYTSTVTTGIVSATGRTVQISADVRLTNLIQTDAAINPGNSGGPLLDAAGAVIGINTAVERDSTGIGFAIPIDIARPIMAQALAGQPLVRPYVGIRYEMIDAKLKAEKHLTVGAGALIGPSTDAAGGSLPAITPGSPAAAAGLKEGDIITAIEGQAVDGEHPLDALLSGYAPGQTVKLSVLRGTTQMTISVTLGTRPQNL